MATVTGTADIKAASGLLATVPSGTITVSHGAATKVRVETAADGSGIVVPAESLASGSSITAYAITRDGLDNFVANVAADAWSLQNITGGVGASDLVPATDHRSAVFTGHAAGSANIMATSGALPTVMSGTITVSSSTGVADGSKPLSYALLQNYPNPFNPSTTIRFQIPQGGQVTLRIFDALGREISTLVNEVLAPGTYQKVWDATGFASGVYFYGLVVAQEGHAPAFAQMQKLLLLK